MDKEKEIEELSAALGIRYQNLSRAATLDIATAITKAGYRKADEVRKEILRGIDQLAAQCGLDEFRAVHLRKYAKQLGVEVDE